MFNFFKKKKKEPESFGAKIVNEAYKDKNERKREIDGYVKVAEDSDNVAYKNKEGKYKIGIAGSQNLEDALTDAKLFIGGDIKTMDRYKKSEEFVKKITEGTSNPDVELFGHSLSGLIVNQMQKDNPNFKTTAYNPYILNKEQLSNETKNIRTMTDPASLLVATHMDNQIKGSSLNPLDSHSILNFRRGGRV